MFKNFILAVSIYAVACALEELYYKFRPDILRFLRREK
jgi:hypothetical protein